MRPRFWLAIFVIMQVADGVLTYAAVEQFGRMRSEGPFTPLRVGQTTLVFPGYDGGAEWGGQAFDPESALYYVNANDLAWTGLLAPDDAGQSGKALYARWLCSSIKPG